MKDARISGYFDTKYMTVLQKKKKDFYIILKIKNLPFFLPGTGQFSHDTRHLCSRLEGHPKSASQ